MSVTIFIYINILMRSIRGGKKEKEEAKTEAKAKSAKERKNEKKEVKKDEKGGKWEGYEESVRGAEGRLEVALKKMEGLENKVNKTKEAWGAYKTASEAREAQDQKEQGRVMSTEEIGKEIERIAEKRGSAVRKGPKDEKYAEYQRELEKEEQRYRAIQEERGIVVTGREKIEEAEEQRQKTLADIKRELARLPESLAALRKS